jgi:hypothetical protein
MTKHHSLSIFAMPALIIAGMAFSLVYANTPECRDSWPLTLQKKLAEGHGNGNGNGNIGSFNGNGNSGNFNGNGKTGNFRGNGQAGEFIGSLHDWVWRDAGNPVLNLRPRGDIPGCK